MTLVDAPQKALPRPYLAWLSGSTVARLGDAVLAFALGWAAAEHGGTTAALVLTFHGLPRLVLLVVGGAVADRVGARRLLIGGEGALVAATVVLALALARFGTPPWLLLTSALALGTITSLCLPATGSMPRRLVPDDQLARALALRQSLNQAALMAAAPLAGLLIGGLGLPALAWGNAAALAVSLGVLIAVRELSGPAPEPTEADPTTTDPTATDRVSANRAAAPQAGAYPTATDQAPAYQAPADGVRARRLDVVDGFRVVARTPGLGRALALTGAGAALILPVPSLLVPLLGRAADWGAGSTGAVAGAVGAGVIAATLRAARHRTPPPTPRGGASVSAGLGVSAVGASVLATGAALTLGGSVAVAVAVVGALVFGFGNGMFVARLAPLVLGGTPRTHLARVQGLVGLVQLVPVTATNLLLGALSEHTSPVWALVATAAGLAGCTAWAGGQAIFATAAPAS